MTKKSHAQIVIEGAKTNNLKNLSTHIPHNKFTVITGVSGSGKSSLIFDIIAKAGQRRYFETLPSFARQFLGKINRPDCNKIEGLSPVIAIGQNTSRPNLRSTVGTISDIYDLLRLLFARTGKSDKNIQLSRALFSFNSAIGKCQQCNGIGQEEKIDLNCLIGDSKKTIREGALAPTLPNGYIMYSQVTIDVLNQVCEAEGFNVDIPWDQLTPNQQKVILYGSDKIKVPFGKHSLESRLKWTGIKAKPREEGYYKGMIPIMSDILKRDRNKNILKYVHSLTCHSCEGARLNEDALRVAVNEKTIAEVNSLEFNALKDWIKKNTWDAIAEPIVQKIKSKIDLLQDLGLGHLKPDRASSSLRASEIQRIRIANQLLVPLSNVLYVFDEPSIGLHSEENKRLIHHLKQLVQKGNTVIVVEHNLDTISSADHIIEIGPKAGIGGGEIIFNGAYSQFIADNKLIQKSPTYRALKSIDKFEKIPTKQSNNKSLYLKGCHERNLKNIDVEIKLGQLNIISGKSGSGKSTLVKDTLHTIVKDQISKTISCVKLKQHENINAIDHLVFIDHSPIGKTPRSNPATYLGVSDHIRDIFANLPESKSLGYTKSRFSFNNKGGRCETCQGAGKTQIGMHFLGKIDLICDSCAGKRFNEETLKIKYKELTIADIYKLSVNSAIPFFEDHKKVLTGLKILQEIGLGYLTLGQSSTTLSGGEAQRIKIANQLQKKHLGNTLYIIIEPSIGMHFDNINTLLKLFDRIKRDGNTIVCIEQNEALIRQSDWHIELGPDSGKAGGTIIHQGSPKISMVENVDLANKDEIDSNINAAYEEIILKDITTHKLKNINIKIPKNKLTVVTGLSGSGKSSLVYDTIFAESHARFTESLSTYNRSFLKQNNEAKISFYSGLGPAIAINRKGGSPSKRSTVGTLSNVYDAFRLLYSRIAQQKNKNFTAQHFSFNHHLGACLACEGLGLNRICNPKMIIVNEDATIFDGAISSNKAIAYYADPNGQFMATLNEVAKQKTWNIDKPWKDLEHEIKNTILFGTGEQIWDVTWTFNTKSRSGTQDLKSQWSGFCNYINDEYQRKINNKNIKHIEELLHYVNCKSCKGSRLKTELLETKFLGYNIHELTQLNILSILDLIENIKGKVDPIIHTICKVVIPQVKKSLRTLKQLGLGYLNLDRPVSTLSGGERQRITLSSQLSTHMFGVTYVLDEPTIGLDADQIKILGMILKQIVSNGNTVIAVEHDPTFIKQADYLIEMGPGTGSLGGKVMFQGKLSDIVKAKQSITYKMLYESQINSSKIVRSQGKSILINGAYANNLKHIDVEIKTNQLVTVTGVSGSGKSSLIKDVLFNSWQNQKAMNCSSVVGLDQFENVIFIDQEILSQSRLITPVTYTGILDELKTIFAKTKQAKEMRLKKADFSYQSKNGRCDTCRGHGKIKTSMDFMSDIWLSCETCKGMRYNNNILNCKINSQSIGDVLKMTIQEAIDFFNTGIIVEKLEVLKNLGIGHLLLGQSGNTLSGGEAQRLKLATFIMQKQKGATLYLFDEPSTGLHYFDTLPLINVFNSLIDRGDTVLYIEHNSTLIEAADQVITLGPGSGEDGGRIVL